MKVALRRLVVAVLVLLPAGASAGQLSPRNITLLSSAPSVTTEYALVATTATTSNIGSIGFQFCTAATGACTVPAGLDTTAATLAGFPGGFTIVTTTNGAPYLQNLSTPSLSSGTVLSYQLSNIVNPSNPNLSYYVRVTTYSGTDGATGPVDVGTVALSTAEPVQLTGVTPEILVFCVGTTIGGDCTTVSGNSIDFGDFSPTVTRSGTSVMQAQTNAASGYVITVNGTTLSSGVNTIPGLTAQTSSVLGNSQFGLNVSGAGSGSGTVNANFNNGSLYRFNTGDTVASATAPTDANTYTSNYIVNIGGSQAAGVYTATMTYICTASF